MSDDSDRPYDSEEGQATAPGSEEGAMDADDQTPDDRATVPEHEMGTTIREVEGERTTAPQSPYTARQVGIGFAVLAVGLLVVFGIPLLFA